MKGMTEKIGAMINKFTISIHIPYEGYDSKPFEIMSSISISIHIPYEGYDGFVLSCRHPCHGFQSTYPMKGMTYMQATLLKSLFVFQSTYPMKGMTIESNNGGSGFANFNPHTLWRVWRGWAIIISHFSGFQSTYPMKGMTYRHGADFYKTFISIHIPYEGYDWLPCWYRSMPWYFNPHTLWRVWRTSAEHLCMSLHFNPHTLWRVWRMGWALPNPATNFNPHTLWRVWPFCSYICMALTDFNPHTLWRVWLFRASVVQY